MTLLKYPEINNCYEFCKTINNISHVLYGRLITVNTSNKTCVFEELNNGIGKKPTGLYYTNINAIRGVYGDYPIENKDVE